MSSISPLNVNQLASYKESPQSFFYSDSDFELPSTGRVHSNKILTCFAGAGIPPL